MSPFELRASVRRALDLIHMDWDNALRAYEKRPSQLTAAALRKKAEILFRKNLLGSAELIEIYEETDVFEGVAR